MLLATRFSSISLVFSVLSRKGGLSSAMTPAWLPAGVLPGRVRFVVLPGHPRAGLFESRQNLLEPSLDLLQARLGVRRVPECPQDSGAQTLGDIQVSLQVLGLDSPSAGLERNALVPGSLAEFGEFTVTTPPDST